MGSSPRSTYAWQQRRAQVIANSDGICSWCGRPVDRTLSGMDRWGPTVDHELALEDGGHLLDNTLTLMHRTCNVRKENERRRTARRPALNPSRTW